MRAFLVLGLVFSTPSLEIGLGKSLRNDLFCGINLLTYSLQVSTLKAQLEQEIRQRQWYLSRPTRDLAAELRTRLDSNTRDIDYILSDHQAKKLLDDLVEPHPIGRAMSPITVAFTRSRSPFQGHRALPRSPGSTVSSMSSN